MQKSLVKLAQDMKSQTEAEVNLLFDPQLFIPGAGRDIHPLLDNSKLRKYDYWPKGYETGTCWQGAALATLLAELAGLNGKIDSKAIILPGLFTDRVDDLWLDVLSSILEGAEKVFSQDSELMATVCIGGEVLRRRDEYHALLERSEEWEVEGVYLIAEHYPAAEYLVRDPVWYAGLFDLIAGFKLQGKRVLLGFAGPPLLFAGCAGADALASGTWLNTRGFPIGKFNEEEGGDKRLFPLTLQGRRTQLLTQDL